MPKNKKKPGETNLSARNSLETLNDVLRLLNLQLPENSRLKPVSSSSDLYELRKRLSADVKVGDVPAPVVDAPKEKLIKVPKAIVDALAAIATNACRARNRMVDPDSGEVKEEMKRVYRDIGAQYDALDQIGIKISDMRGKPYDAGMALTVITFEPQPGLSKDQIIETIKPTVTWNGQMIQVGEVIVGTPQSK